jgi:hypothetical protein
MPIGNHDISELFSNKLKVPHISNEHYFILHTFPYPNIIFVLPVDGCTIFVDERNDACLNF